MNSSQDTIPFFSGSIPSLTTQQMIEVDRAMIEDYQIKLIQMMENAGRTLAHLARQRFLEGNPDGRRVVVLAGTGGNGGGALVGARRLHNYGAQVQVFTTKDQDEFTPTPAHQLDILVRMGLPMAQAGDLPSELDADLIIDGVIGYNLQGAPRGSAAEMIRWANVQNAPVLALDVPSGVDASRGGVHKPAVQAAATLTLALPKLGLQNPDVAAQVGELYLADISVPPGLYRALGLQVGPLFAESDLLRLR